jgi:hypothetical protein
MMSNPDVETSVGGLQSEGFVLHDQAHDARDHARGREGDRPAHLLGESDAILGRLDRR